MLYNLTNEFTLISESEGCIYNLGNSVIEINTTQDKNQGILLLPGENQSFTKTVYCRSVEAAGKIAVNEFLTEASGSGGGGEAVLTTTTVKSTTTVQTVTPESGYDGFSSVTVSPIDLETKTVKSTTTSQTITPTSGKDGISEVTVEALDLETKTVKSSTSSQTITPTSGKDGFSSVTVSPINLEPKAITQNGTYTPSQGKDGFSVVNVNVTPSEVGGKLNQLLKVYNGGTPWVQLLESDFDGVTYLGYTFYSNKGLMSAEIPSSVTTIGQSAFRYCSELKTVIIDNPSILTLKGYVFQQAGINPPNGLSITFKNMNNKIYDNWRYDQSTFEGANIKQISIPNGTLYLAQNCFRNCTNLETVNLPTELNALISGEFYGCSKLASVTIPAKCSIVQASVFTQCPSLRTVNIEDRINSSATINISSLAWDSTVTTINIYCRKSQVVTASSAPWGASSSCQVNWLHPDDQV